MLLPRPTSQIAELDEQLRTPAPMQLLRRGRYLAGLAIAAGTFALLSHGDVAGADESYKIKQGDTLSHISANKGVSVQSLVAANRLANQHKIVAGETLIIPTKTPANTAKSKAVAAAKPTGGSGGLPPDLAASTQRKKLHATFTSASKTYGIPGDLLPALTYHESGWNNSKVSSAGAQGIGQLMPDTVAFVNENLVSKPLDPSVPEQNIKMSAAYMRYLLDQTGGDSTKALAAYYQGLGALRERGMYNDTKQYIASVRALQNAYF